MENVSNISSEEELLQLRNEGKISEAEYNDLLVAMRTPSPNDLEEVALRIDDARTKRKQGKTAFVLMLVGILVGIIFPFVGLALAASPFGKRAEATRMSSDGTIGPEKAAQLMKEAKQRAEQLSRELKDKHTRILITTRSCLLIGLVLEIAAFVMGVISWPEVFAKATVIAISVISAIVVLGLLFKAAGLV